MLRFVLVFLQNYIICKKIQIIKQVIYFYLKTMVTPSSVNYAFGYMNPRIFG
jgi:hypothetical protein